MTVNNVDLPLRDRFEAAARILRCAALGGMVVGLLVGDPSLVNAQLAPPAPATSEADVLLGQGREAFAKGNFPVALSILQEVVRQQPTNAEALLTIGQILLQMQQFPQAVEFFQKAIAAAPDNMQLRLSVGSLYEQVNLNPAAINEYRYVFENVPNTAEGKEAEKRLNIALAKEYTAKGDLDTSLQILSSLAEEFPEDTRVLQHLGFAYLLAKRFEHAVTIYEEVLEREPKNDTAHFNLASVFERMGDVSGAVAELSKVVDLVPDTARGKEARLRRDFLEAEVAARAGDLVIAAQRLEDAVAAEPRHPTAWSLLGNYYGELKQFDKAEIALDKAVQVVPNNLDARLKLAMLQLNQNNYVDALWHLELLATRATDTQYGQQAQQLLQRAAGVLGDNFAAAREAGMQKARFLEMLSADPNSLEANFNLGIIYRQQGKNKEARERFETVLKVDPSIARAYLILAELSAQQGDVDTAVNLYNEYISRETDSANIERIQGQYAMVLGQQLLKERRFEAAVAQFKRVQSINPGDPGAHYFAGISQMQQGRFDDAKAEFEAVIEKSPEHMNTRMNLALVYQQLGKDEEALTEFRRVALNPPSDDARQFAEQRVRILQRALNGVTPSASYSLTFDDNSNLFDEYPEEEYYSTLAVTLNYRYKYSETWRYGFVFNPSYTTYHIGQYDYLTETYTPSASYIKGNDTYGLRASYFKVSGVLNNENVNESTSFAIDRVRQMDSVRQLTLGYSRRYFASATTDIFDAVTDTITGELARNFGNGQSDAFGANVAVNRNTDPINEAAAYDSAGVTYRYTRWFSAKFVVTVNGSYQLTYYPAEDLFAQKNRITQLGSLNLSTNYRLNDAFGLYTTLGWQKNEANLPIYVRDPVTGDIRPRGPQDIGGQDLVGVPLQSAALGDYQKFLVTVGLTVNF